MSESNLPKGVRKILELLAAGTIGTAVAARRLGDKLDKKLGTENMSAFPIKKGFKGSRKSLIKSREGR